MKLLQLNCWGGKLTTPLRRMIDREKPDIVCLQEAIAMTPRPGSVQAPYQSFLPPEIYPFDLYAPTFSLRYMHEMIKLGNALVSKHPISATNIVFTAGKFKKDIDSLTGDYNIRNFAHATVEINGKPLHIITHHGHHSPEGKDGSPESTRQIQIVADYVQALNGPVIVTGDFNLHPSSRSLQPLNELLRNLPVEYKVTSTRTQFAKRQEVIDYIFVSHDMEVKNFCILEDLVSDHTAMLVEF